MVDDWLRLAMRNDYRIPMTRAPSMGCVLQRGRDALIFFPDGGSTQI